MKRPLGSLLLWLWMALITPPFSLLALLLSRCSPQTRYRGIAAWSHLVIYGARYCCGIRWRLHGMHNLPPQPSLILSRHESTWETLAYQVLLPPQVFVLKKELLRIPFFGYGLSQMSPIAIDRAAGRAALREMREAGAARIADGFHIVVFPEGTRLSADARAPYHIGGAWLAKELQIATVPIALNSSNCWPTKGWIKKSGVIDVCIGPPIAGQNLSAAEINERARQWIEEESGLLAATNTTNAAATAVSES